MANLKRNVLMVQVNYQYGDNVFIPYAVGSIQAYAETIQEIRAHFQFQNPLFLREDLTTVIQKMSKPDVVGISCYIWNWEYNQCLAQAIKKAFPQCLIVFGGTQVPDNSKSFFRDHPYVDILVHQEGEISFAEILRESLSEKPDYAKIAGLSIKVNGNETLKTEPSVRIKDLSVLPSPYLAGVFDFLADKGYTLNVTQETNRGCPYQCTFCDWGGSTYSKVTAFPEERILSEFAWFGINKTAYLFNADANYGIWPRDLELTEKMIASRQQHDGHPISFRMCTAKKSNKRIFDIAQLLNDAGMNKGATLSFQSMDADTLTIVKRSNIKIESFSDLMDDYKAAGISTYTELIMGMPGETYISSKEGVDILFDVQASSVNLYAHACTSLTNSEMGDPLYARLHGIKVVKMPILLAHSTPESGHSIPEYHNVIIETKTMPHDDWVRTYLFYWAVQGLHCLGLLQHVSMFMRRTCNLRYSDFYERLVNHFSNNITSLIGREITTTKEIVIKATHGGRLDIIDEKLGYIYWPLEEASFLHFISRKEVFFKEIRDFLDVLILEKQLTIDRELLDDVVRYQSLLMRDPCTSTASATFSYNLPEYFSKFKEKTLLLTKNPVTVSVAETKQFTGDIQQYAQEVVWYGRRGGSFHHTPLPTLK